MTNTNIQGAVPLAGSGYVAKRKGNYNPGEFKYLVNAEVNNDGVVVNRKSIRATADGAYSFANPYPFVGYIEDYAIVASPVGQKAVSSGANIDLWAPTGLPVPAGGYHKIIGAFKYNKTYYWLTVEYNPTGPVYNVCLYYTTTTPLSAVTFANLTRKVIITGSTRPGVSSFFIHKERLFVATEQFVYFSKATDPTIFTVPDGGFFGMADTKIKYAFGLNDTIYVLSDSSTSVFSYSVDPNNDGYLRAISTTVGGEWGCVHQSTPYLVNRSGIYAINNLNVEKIHDTELDVGDNIFQNKIVSFEDYLVLIRRFETNYDAVASTSALYYNKLGKTFTPGQSGNTRGYNVFFINTRNGSTHVVDFTDNNDSGNKGYVVDAMVNPNRDFAGDYRLFFLTNTMVSAGNYTAGTYFMNPEPGVDVYDSCRKSDGTVAHYKGRILIEVDSYVPDGNEYAVKKFRNLMVMAKFPSSDFGVEVAFDNAAYSRGKVNLINGNSGRGYYPARVGINQRGRSISIKFSTSNDLSPLSGVTYDNLEISDLRVLWTYTSRVVEDRYQSVTP